MWSGFLSARCTREKKGAFGNQPQTSFSQFLLTLPCSVHNSHWRHATRIVSPIIFIACAILCVTSSSTAATQICMHRRVRILPRHFQIFGQRTSNNNNSKRQDGMAKNLGGPLPLCSAIVIAVTTERELGQQQQQSKTTGKNMKIAKDAAKWLTISGKEVNWLWTIIFLLRFVLFLCVCVFTLSLSFVRCCCCCSSRSCSSIAAVVLLSCCCSRHSEYRSVHLYHCENVPRAKRRVFVRRCMNDYVRGPSADEDVDVDMIFLLLGEFSHASLPLNIIWCKLKQMCTMIIHKLNGGGVWKRWDSRVWWCARRELSPMGRSMTVNRYYCIADIAFSEDVEQTAVRLLWISKFGHIRVVRPTWNSPKLRATQEQLPNNKPKKKNLIVNSGVTKILDTGGYCYYYYAAVLESVQWWCLVLLARSYIRFSISVLIYGTALLPLRLLFYAL